MADDTVMFRIAAAADVPAIARVRTSVRENLLTIEQLAERGITNESVAASFAVDHRGWVAIVGFSIADRATRSIFALFVLPGHEGRGIGGLELVWLPPCAQSAIG